MICKIINEDRLNKDDWCSVTNHCKLPFSRYGYMKSLDNTRYIVCKSDENKFYFYS